MENRTDVFIIGGGINGTAIAADAAGRGLSVIVCEKDDLASGTSSASTKLIHGGLRYLEQYEFRLVKHALAEREILMRRAPNIISPLEFILPQGEHSRPAWLIRLGLLFYDHLSKRRYLPGSKYINLKKDVRGNPLLPHYRKGFSYYDCFTDDARLVVLNAISAHEQGAIVLVNTAFKSAERINNNWKIVTKNTKTNTEKIYYSKVLINCSGPWINETQKLISTSRLEFPIELVKGSHIILPKLYEGNFAYIFQNSDGRIIFTIPYQHKFTLIGTTDISFEGNPNQVEISDQEKLYLCHSVNQYFQKKIAVENIKWSFAGIRCLQEKNDEKPQKITRGYKLILDDKNNCPLLSFIGGKLTTHRIMAKDMVDHLKKYFPGLKESNTAATSLPGSDFENANFANFYHTFKKNYNWLPESLALRYATNYGTRAYLLLNTCNSLQDLGEDFSNGLYQKEVEYLITKEWATSVEDVLWRRTKLGLLLDKANCEQLAKHFRD